jgi:hypothetical protein
VPPLIHCLESLSCQFQARKAVSIVKSSQALSTFCHFRSKIDPIEGLVTFVRVNLWMKLEDVAPGVYFNELESIPMSMNMVQSTVIKEFPLLTSYIVGKEVHHISKFDLASMDGYLNSLCTRFRFDCFNKAASEIDGKKHISSPADLYGKSFPCLSMGTLEKCRETLY